MAENTGMQVPHSVMLEDRNKLTVEGVSDIAGYDEQSVVAKTALGDLTIRGSGLKIIRMSVDMGELIVEGQVSSLTYFDVQEESGGFWSRVFR